MSQIIAVSQPTYDALTDTDPNHFIFHSAYNTFKIVYQGKTTLSILAGSNTYTIAHNSPHTNPCLQVFIQFPDGVVTVGNLLNNNSYNFAHSVNSVSWDDTYIYVEDDSVVNPYSLTVVWYVFETTL